MVEDLVDRRVTTRRAAEIAGMGYEGLRTCLKRGLLKHTGMLLPFVERGQPIPELDAKRWTWKEFHIADVCLYRLAKILMDAGLSFENVKCIANREDLWQFFWGNYFIDGPVAVRYIAVTVADIPDYGFYSRDGILSEIGRDALSEGAGVILVDLVALHETVAAAICQPSVETEDAVA